VAISNPTPVPVNDVPGAPVQPVPLSEIDRAPAPVAVTGEAVSIPRTSTSTSSRLIGATGPRGLEGLTGPIGPAGPQGATGTGSGSGSVGATGLQGATGVGTPGATGTSGTVTLPLANGTSNFDIATADDNVTITANSVYTWTFGANGNTTLPSDSAIQTAPGSNGNILIHPDGNGRVVILGGTNTLLTLAGVVPNTQNRFEIDTYGDNLGNLGGGVFTGTYIRLGNPTQADDRLASFAGKGSADGINIQEPTAARITLDAAANWTATSTPSHISFWTTPPGVSVPRESVRIGSAGNLIIFNGNLTVAAGNISVAGNITSNRSVVTTPTALANLTAVAGGRAFVNDANLAAAGNFGNQIGSGGSNTVPVWSDGTNWYIG